MEEFGMIVISMRRISSKNNNKVEKWYEKYMIIVVLLTLIKMDDLQWLEWEKMKHLEEVRRKMKKNNE